MSAIWNNIFVNPILNILVFLYQYTGNLGIAIIVLTLVIRFLLLPVVVPQMKSMKKQRAIQPELKKLRKKYGKDQKVLAQKQMEVFKKHGINPTSGCLSQIVMLTVLISLFTVIRMFTLNGDANLNDRLYHESLHFDDGYSLNTDFLYLDLAQPDQFFVLAILSGFLQLMVGKMMMPEEKELKQAEKAAKKTEPGMDDMAVMMQKQSLYMMPIISVLIGLTLPSGLMLYIITQSIFQMVLTYRISGWGGLKPWIKLTGLVS